MKTNSLNHRSSHFAALALACVAFFSICSPVVQAQTTTRFNDGYLTVFRVTSGSTLASTGTAIVLDEYAPSGSSQSTPNYSLSLPSVTSGLGANDIVVSGTATSAGEITRSENGRYIAIPGYKNLIGDANTSFNTTAVVRLANGTGTMSAGISGANYSSGNNNLRGAVTDDGNFFWCTGNGTGVIGIALSAPTTLTTVSSTSSNNRGAYIYNGQLYLTTGAGSQGIYSVGSGKPTSSGNTATRLYVPTNTDPYAFSISPDAKTIYYVASISGGIYRSTFDGASWTAGTQIYSATGMTGIAVDWSGYTFSTSSANGAKIYANTPTVLYSANDNGTATVSATTLRTISGNNAFRGLAFSPIKQSVSKGSSTPATGTISSSGSNVVLFQFSVSADEGNSTVKSVVVTKSGTATIGTGNNISNFRLIDDADNDGAASSGELATPLASGTVSGNDITFSSISLSSYINQGSSKNFLVVADISGGAGNTFIPTISSDKSLNGVNYTTKVGNAGGSWVTIGAAAPTGNTLTIVVPPSITAVTLTSSLTNTYGTASAGVSYTATGTSLTGQITNTPASGFEISTNSSTSGFSTNAIAVSTNTTVWVRTAASRVPGTNNSTTVVTLASTGVSNANVTTSASSNVVSIAPLAVTGLSGVNKAYDGLTTASATGTAAVSGLVGTDTVTLGGTATYTFSSASVGTSKSITTTGYTITGGQSSYYTLTQPTLSANITARALTVTANNVNKVQGATLTGGSGSTAFTSSGLQNGETIGSVTITYGSGAASTDVAGTYNGSVTPSAATGGTFTSSNYSINYVAGNIVVSATPTISAPGTLSAVSTTYGTATASPTSISVSGGNLTGDLSVSVPSGFEVSSDGSTYSAGPLTLTASSGSVASTTLYVRLAATAGVSGSPYSGNLSITGGGASTVNVAIPSSTVTAKGLTITGISIADKVYDGATTATISGTAAYSGLVNSESFSVTGSPTASFGTKTVGSAKSVTVSGYTAPSSNYSISQPTGLTASITAKALTVTGGAVTSKTYDGGTAATITGATLSGVVAGDTVNLVGTGTFASANVGTGIAVTSTLSGTDSGNYSLTQPTGLTGDITKANQTITFGALAAKTTADAPFALTATANSGLTVTYTSSNTGVATVAGNTVTIVGAGSTTITASQAGDSNYNAATSVPQTLTVSTVPTLTEVYVPQFIEGGMGTTNSKRLPYAYRVTLNNLNPNATYRYFNAAVIDADSATTAGAGNPIFVTATGNFVRSTGGSLSTAGNYSTFTTDANGSFTGWFMLEPTGNATRFATAGTQIKMRIILNNGSDGNTTATTYLTTSSYVTVTPLGSTSSNGTAIRGSSSASAKNFVLLYDNIDGTGRPLTATVVEGDGVANTTANNFASFYATSVDEVSGAWGAIIPNTLANGVRRIENRAKSDGSLLAFNTDADGAWASGANTVNPTGGDTTPIVITSTDAPLAPAISTSGTLAAVSTTYGTASSSTQFSVSGANMTAGILVTPPSGFEVSTDNSTFSATVTVGSSGTISSTMVYVRLAATAAAGSKSGNITLTSSGAANVNVATVTSTISQKSVTISGLTGINKIYDGGTTATTSGTASYSGLVNGESYSVLGTPVASFANSTVGTNKVVTITGYLAPTANYTLTTDPTTTADITAKGLTGSFTAADKSYDGTTAATVTGRSVSGKVGSDDVSLSGGTATFDSASAGNGKTVTLAGASLSGTAVGNYSLTSVSTTTANITAANLPAITWSNGVISSASGVSSFSYTYGGRNTNGVNTSYSSANAPTAAGFYTAVATSTDGNYTGSTTNNYFVPGPVAVADAVTKPADNQPMTLTLASLLANDVRITAAGAVATDGLSITAVSGGSGNSAQIDGGDVLYTPGNASPETFTYTLSYGGQTATGTVTVTTETSAPTFALQIVKVGTAVYSAGSTTMTNDFIGVPNQIYAVEYSTDLTNWTSAGDQSTGSTGSFSVTISQAGNVTSAWNTAMFFRAKVNP